MIKPIRPSEIPEFKLNLLPDFVITAFNKLIAINYNGTSSQFTQEEIVDVIYTEAIAQDDSFKREYIYRLRYLDVEDLYQKAGWKVEYDKPGFNESYEPVFKFSK